MKQAILTVNAGSSSLKLALFDLSLNKIEEGTDWKDFVNNKEIAAIGHRYVHGGPDFIKSILINDLVIEKLKKTLDLAPLHNESCLKGIEQCKALFGNVPQCVVFDTAFHSTLPEEAALYAIPLDLTRKYHIRRYGFHGISHASLWELYKKNRGEGKIITLHLGNGCSISAIDNGVPKETSMGFTPAEGLIMGTRAGNIDAGVIEFLSRKENKSASEILKILNFESGLLGVSSLSSDMRKLLESQEPSAKLAIDMFCHRVLMYIGAYQAVLGGVDALVFSGGIGENSPVIREKIVQAFEQQGIYLDKEKNESAVKAQPGSFKEISKEDSKIRVFVAGTDENRYIARETIRIALNYAQ